MKMEKRTSKVFKAWMTYEDAWSLPQKKPLAQGTAEDRVTAVNNEFRRLSFGGMVTVFDDDGNVVADIHALCMHVKSVKRYLDGGHYREERNKYGIKSFAEFLTWLCRYAKLKRNEEVLMACEDPENLPCWDVFRAYLLRRFGGVTGNVRSIVSRVIRVFNAALQIKATPTRDELESMIQNMGRYVENPGSAANCRVAIRHYIRAIYK